MDENMWERWGAASGIIFVVLLLVGVTIAGTPPHIDASHEKLASYFADHQRGIETSAMLTAFAAMFFVWFVSHLRHVLQRAESGSEALSPIVFGSGMVLAAAGTLSVVPMAVLGFSANNPDVMGDTGLVRLLWNTNAMMNAIMPIVTVLFLVSTSVAMVRRELVAPWLGWAGLVAAFIGAVSGIAGFYVSTYNAFWNYLGFAGLLLFAAFMLVASAAMIRAPEVSRGVAPRPVFGH